MWWASDAGYFWYQAPVETQALMIEAYDEIALDEKTVEELNQLFYPNLLRMTAAGKRELVGTEYLVCKQIVRDHDEFAIRRGCCINAEPCAEGGFTVYFTIPGKIIK